MSGTLLLAFLTLQRLAELFIAAANTQMLLRNGACEYGAQHYPVMVALHATWLVTLWILGWNHGVSLLFVGVFAVLQIGRIWVLGTLGKRWTTRIIVPPKVAPIIGGPYRFVRHPNYVIVALDLPCVSLALGLLGHAVLFGLLNLPMLAWRVRAEDRAFAQ